MRKVIPMKANISTVAEFPQYKPKRKPCPVLTTQHKRSVQAVMAGIAAGFLPVASYVIAHIEAQSNPILYALVVAALIYSAPREQLNAAFNWPATA